MYLEMVRGGYESDRMTPFLESHPIRKDDGVW
jgi:hypothetical protein